MTISSCSCPKKLAFLANTFIIHKTIRTRQVVFMNSENIFTQRLLDARRLRDLNQEELAKRAGLKPSAISHFETGSRKPSFDNLRRLSDALEVTTDYLLGRADDPHGVIKGDTLYRDYENLTSQDREIAKDFMASLAKRSKERKEK